MSVYYLSRFRADPSRVRVSIRRCADKWIATIGPRDPSMRELPTNTVVDASALKALARCFQFAEADELPGIDRHMQWAYEHPQGALGPRATRRVVRDTIPAPNAPGPKGAQ